MLAAKRRDTAPEMHLRSELHRRGLRFRVDAIPLPGVRRRADIVFRTARVAVYVDGCFWHGCPVHGTWPKANAEWWRTKIVANRDRDADTDRRMSEADWLVVRVWEHEGAAAADRVESAVRSKQASQANTLRPS
jgi:DNA mismatch endonuclease (patch repair protein)